MSRASRLLWVGIAALACASGAVAAAPVVLTDSAHHELRLEHPPERIASLMPSLTEIVCELGECARVVVVDRYSDWPESIARLPKAGGPEDAQIEQIVSAHPDVVLAAHEPRVVERLRGLGLAVFEFKTEGYAGISRNVTILGALLGVPERAERLNRQIDQSVAEIAAGARSRLGGREPLVYYEVDPTPYAAGPRSFIGAMLARLGARNIVTPDLGPFPQLNPEYVVRANPEVIFVSPTDAPRLLERPGWERIRAVHEHRICSFAPEVRDTIVRPGPRVAEGMRAMSECLIKVAP